MKSILQKKIHPLITYPILIIFSVVVVMVPTFLYITSPAAAQSFLLPFEGRITDVDYVSCVCGLSTLITIEPTTEKQQGKQPQQFLFFYAAQALDDLFGISFSIAGEELYPQVFPFYMIWSSGSQRLLGNYIPTPLPCVAYTGTSCAIQGSYPAILFVGTSLY